MPHAAFYVVQQRWEELFSYDNKFQCRTQHFMWCNQESNSRTTPNLLVSMPHAAFYVVQQNTQSHCQQPSRFNAARSILCGATTKDFLFVPPSVGFNAARSIICGATQKIY